MIAKREAIELIAVALWNHEESRGRLGPWEFAEERLRAEFRSRATSAYECMVDIGRQNKEARAAPAPQAAPVAPAPSADVVVMRRARVGSMVDVLRVRLREDLASRPAMISAPRTASQMRTRWSPKLDAELSAHWIAGTPTKEIGRRMSLSKGAVVGRAHRIGLKPRPAPAGILEGAQRKRGFAETDRAIVATILRG